MGKEKKSLNHFLVNFDDTPYRREDFQYTGKDDEPSRDMIALWQAIEKSL